MAPASPSWAALQLPPAVGILTGPFAAGSRCLATRGWGAPGFSPGQDPQGSFRKPASGRALRPGPSASPPLCGGHYVGVALSMPTRVVVGDAVATGPGCAPAPGRSRAFAGVAHSGCWQLGAGVAARGWRRDGVPAAGQPPVPRSQQEGQAQTGAFGSSPSPTPRTELPGTGQHHVATALRRDGTTSRRHHVATAPAAGGRAPARFAAAGRP